MRVLAGLGHVIVNHSDMTLRSQYPILHTGSVNLLAEQAVSAVHAGKPSAQWTCTAKLLMETLNDFRFAAC